MLGQELLQLGYDLLVPAELQMRLDEQLTPDELGFLETRVGDAARHSASGVQQGGAAPHGERFVEHLDDTLGVLVQTPAGLVHHPREPERVDIVEVDVEQITGMRSPYAVTDARLAGPTGQYAAQSCDVRLQRILRRFGETVAPEFVQQVDHQHRGPGRERQCCRDGPEFLSRNAYGNVFLNHLEGPKKSDLHANPPSL
jgi:hypothetical protein